jgi:hypothetical protein
LTESTTLLTAAVSLARPRSGFATATTGYPADRRAATSASQLEESANAPWTRTIVGAFRGAGLTVAAPAAWGAGPEVGADAEDPHAVADRMMTTVAAEPTSLVPGRLLTGCLS